MYQSKYGGYSILPSAPTCRATNGLGMQCMFHIEIQFTTSPLVIAEVAVEIEQLHHCREYYFQEVQYAGFLWSYHIPLTLYTKFTGRTIMYITLS